MLWHVRRHIETVQEGASELERGERSDTRWGPNYPPRAPHSVTKVVFALDCTENVDYNDG